MMAATKQDISNWFDEGVKKGATHMLVVCDTYDWDDYPVYVMPGEDARTKAGEYNGTNMQSLMECYNLSKPKDIQLDHRRTFDYD